MVCLGPFLAGKLYLVQSRDRCILLQQITWVSSSLWLHLGLSVGSFYRGFQPQNRMEANMQNMVTKTEMQSMETNMQRMAATLQRIEQAITERDDENQG